MVLVDTSVWIDFFSARPKPASRQLADLIEAGQVVTCRAVIAEVLSGEMAQRTRVTVTQAMHSLPLIDRDWNADAVWTELVELALNARAEKQAVPGLVDRMLLLSALRHPARIWSYDRKLHYLAGRYRILFEAGGS